MVFWSFLAGVATFYCSIGPETLLPNIFFSIKAKYQVRAGSWAGGVAPPDCFSSHSSSRSSFLWAAAAPSAGRSSANATGTCTFLQSTSSGVLQVLWGGVVTIKYLCVRRPTLLLENHQPWLDLKVHSKVDASVTEVTPRPFFTLVSRTRAEQKRVIL